LTLYNLLDIIISIVILIDNRKKQVIKEFKELSQIRKYTVYNAFLVALVNAFVIAITLTLVIKLFGADGAMFKQYATNIWPLLIVIPFFGNLTSKDPRKFIRLSVIAEILSLVLFAAAQYGFYSSITFVSGLAVLLTSNVLMNPPRTQVNSIIINGEKDFSIFLEKIRSMSLALGSIVGLGVIYFELDILVNIIGMFICLVASRFFVIKLFDEVFSEIEENEKIDNCLESDNEEVNEKLSTAKT
tara:strand:- start:10625 stop:11356 length:732 start_codon:yes stop_codon:yes gene_type:complete